MTSISAIHRRGASALALLACLTAPLWAQPVGNIRSTLRVTIRPERMGDFRAAVKEYVAVVKKAKWDKSFSLWNSQSGPREFVLSTVAEKWAELDVTQDPKLKDVAGELAAISARINQAVETTVRAITEVQPDLSLPRIADPPKMIRVLRTEVRPDKVEDYLALLKAEVLPAVKKSGATVFSVARTRYGAPSSEIVTVVGAQSWAEQDKESPIVAAMGGQQAYAKFLAKITPLMIRSQWDVYSYEADLSYTPGR